jgi:hypothetical protein
MTRLVVESSGSTETRELDLLKAFEMIKKWHDYEISPRYQMDEMGMHYRGDEIEIKAEWYTPEGGWNLERVMVRLRKFFLLQQAREVLIIRKCSHL